MKIKLYRKFLISIIVLSGVLLSTFFSINNFTSSKSRDAVMTDEFRNTTVNSVRDRNGGIREVPPLNDSLEVRPLPPYDTNTLIKVTPLV